MRILSLAVIEDWRFSDMVTRVWGMVERIAPLRGALQEHKASAFRLLVGGPGLAFETWVSPRK
jgi:hypothetical protein